MDLRIRDPTIWPQPSYQGISLKRVLQSYNPPTIPYRRLPQKIVDYLLYICQLKKLTPKTFQTTLYISVRYLLKTSKIESMQLIILASLMLATKIFDYYYISIAQLHEISNHEFTSKDFQQMQTNILVTLDFNIFAECSNKDLNDQGIEQNSHTTMCEILMAVLQATSALISKDKVQVYHSTAIQVFHLYLYTLYTADLRKSMLINMLNPRYAICLILKTTLIILTQCQGNFPQVIWIQHWFNFRDTVQDKKLNDQFDQTVVKIMEVMLGKEVNQIFS